MWTPKRASLSSQRSPSVHSIASHYSIQQTKPMSASTPQRLSRGYESDQASDTTLEDDHVLDSVTSPQQMTPVVDLVKQKLGLNSRSDTNVATMSLEDRSWPSEEKRDNPTNESSVSNALTPAKDEGAVQNKTIPDIPYAPGPLESQLAALMSKIVYIEQKQPTAFILPEEHAQVLARLRKLEEEKQTWWKRHEAIWALRDEDVENNIKIRGLLAKANRELEETRKLRDEDLSNVQILRSKLAERTRETERLRVQSGQVSPKRTRQGSRPGSRPGSIVERRDTTDLFTAAKMAALEQRVLELEERNASLVTQLDASKGVKKPEGSSGINANVYQQGKIIEAMPKLEPRNIDIASIQSPAASSKSTSDWHRMEALLDEHGSYRESTGARLQALRSEKEVLQRDLHRKEDECQSLELRVQMLQRRLNIV